MPLLWITSRSNAGSYSLNTEPEYFNSFRLTSAVVKAVGKGLGTMSLVKEVISLRSEELRNGHTFDYYRVVFDRDEYSDFDEFIRKLSE